MLIQPDMVLLGSSIKRFKRCGDRDHSNTACGTPSIANAAKSCLACNSYHCNSVRSYRYRIYKLLLTDLYRVIIAGIGRTVGYFTYDHSSFDFSCEH